MTYAPFKGISYPQHNFESAYTTLLEIKHLIEIIAGIKEPGRRAVFIDELEALKAQLINMINNAGAGIEEAPLDGTQYGRQSGAWTPVVGGGGGGGDVFGPGSATPDNPTVFNGATGKVIKEISYGTFKTNLALVKGDVGLGNVDNTSDMNKPVSTAQAAADALKANIASPTFTGDPKAPTPVTADNDTSIATTAFVKAQNYAPLASPVFTGNPTGPTPTPGDNDTSLATTAFVTAALAATPGVTILDTPPGSPIHGDLWWESDTGELFIYYDDGTSAQWVVASPAGGSGDVTGPSSSTNGNPVVFDGTSGKVIAETTYAAFKVSLVLTKSDVGLSNVDNTSDLNKPISTATQAALDLKASLASPVLTGNPTAPTPTAGDNDTSIATTAFVTAAIAAAPSSVPVDIADTAPGSPAHGDLWWESDTGQLFLYYNDGTSSQWVAVVPSYETGDVSGPSSSTDGNPVVFDGVTGKLIAEITYGAFKTNLALTKSDVGLSNVLNVAQEPAIAAGTTAQYWRGDKSWQTLDKTAVGLGNVDNTSDANKPVSTAQQTALDLKANLASPALTGNPTAPTATAGDNDTSIATTAFVTAAVGAVIASADAMVFKGVIDCSANPNYPAADRGWTYRVSVAGKIGGASGPNVEVGDLLLCLTDGTVAGNHATVGANWTIAQANIDGAVTGPVSSVSGNPAVFSGTSGKVIAEVTFAAFKTSLALTKSDVGLSNVLNVAQEPAITAGTTGQYWRGDKTWQTLDKTAVGLGNVDNTSDANKPVSTATQTALNLKANLASPALTGNPTAPTPTVGDNDTSIATTAFVTAAVAASAAGGSVALVADNAPGSPTNGQLWYESDTGRLFIYYQDGTSNQWVQVIGGM